MEARAAATGRNPPKPDIAWLIFGPFCLGSTLRLDAARSCMVGGGGTKVSSPVAMTRPASRSSRAAYFLLRFTDYLSNSRTMTMNSRKQNFVHQRNPIHAEGPHHHSPPSTFKVY